MLVTIKQAQTAFSSNLKHGPLSRFSLFFFILQLLALKRNKEMTGLGELRQRLLHPYYVLHTIYGLAYVGYRLNQLMATSINFEVIRLKPS